MDMLENKQARKRRVTPVVKVALAAALAVGCIAMIAAGLPARVYHFIGGGSVTVNPGTNTAYYDRLYEVPPIELDEDGRVWFTADGQHLDITGKVDENTPYIYERTDEATGQKGYLVVGGSHDNLGWMEWYQVDGDWFWHAENCLKGSSAFSVGAIGAADATIVVEVPDDSAPEMGEPAPTLSGAEGYTTESEYTTDGSASCAIDFRPWVEAANEHLAGIGVIEYEPQVD